MPMSHFYLILTDRYKDLQQASVRIRDQSGKLVKTPGPVSGSRIRMDLTGLENGFYLLEIMPSSGKSVYSKLIKMK